MNWTQDLIDKHERTIQSLRDGVAMMQRGTLSPEEPQRYARHNALTDQVVADHERIIGRLESVVERLRQYG